MEQPAAMQRPPSIVRYERLYLAAVAFGLASSIFSWPQSTASFARNPTLAEMMWLLPVLTTAGVALRLALWYFTARRPSTVAKWAVVAFAAAAALILLFGIVALISDAVPSLPAALAGIVSGALHVVAAAYLFRPDAKTWFGELDDIGDPVA